MLSRNRDEKTLLKGEGLPDPQGRALWRLSMILREIASSPSQRQSDPAADDQHSGDDIQDSGTKLVSGRIVDKE